MPIRTRFRLWSSKVLTLPYLADFTTFGDGPLSWPWSGSTWSISSGAAINVPTLGLQALADPGMEGLYTAGLCACFTKSGSPTLAQSGTVHGGAKAQSFQAAAFNNRLTYPAITPIANQWYEASVWGYLTTGGLGTPQLWIYQASTGVSRLVSMLGSVGAYSQYGAPVHFGDAGNVNLYAIAEKGAAGPYDTIIVDDASFRPITFSTLVNWLPVKKADVTIKIRFGQTIHGFCGAIARSDSNGNSNNHVIMRAGPSQTNLTTFRAVLEKCVGGVYTGLIDVNTNFVANKDFELRLIGTTASIWFNGVQIGANQVLDASLTNNPYFGAFGSEGARLTRFFAQAS